MNSQEFYEKINNLSTNYEDRDLEEYLLALYKKVGEHEGAPLTYDLALKIITESFASEPAEFQKEWLNYNEAPDRNRISKKFTNPLISESIDKANTSTLKPFEFTLEVLKFQIAELHRMRGKQLDNEYRYFGIESETGHHWYNFTPFENLECGARCMVDNNEDFDTLNWSFIGELLENGRVYE